MRLLITQTPSPLTLDAQNRRVFPAQISFEGYNTYPITVTDPFTPAQEAELEWYYERWLNFPFTDKIRAQHAAESIRAYGHDLFNQLFRSRSQPLRRLPGTTHRTLHHRNHRRAGVPHPALGKPARPRPGTPAHRRQSHHPAQPQTDHYSGVR
ncbi:MAG: hypothetical protein V9G20_22540 [Candidatus Promineifilaceae bacterium]